MQNLDLFPEGDPWKLTAKCTRAPVESVVTEEAAIGECARFMGKHPGSLKIHKKDGTIEEERTSPPSAPSGETQGQWLS